MRQPDVTYGQLEKALRSLGFTRRIFERQGKGVRFEHKETGAKFSLPLYPSTEQVLDHHMVMVRSMLEGFGVADPSVLEAKLRKTA